MKRINKLLYILTFIALYAGTALVSTLHAFDFFKMSNVTWIAALLAVCFELGQAAVLFSILTTKAERGKILPWVLMCILTLVQIIGNVFASYKYIILNSLDSLKYFKDPIFVWMEMPDEQSTVILTYIASAILPIVALAMTAMITSFLNNTSDEEDKKLEAKAEEPKPLIDEENLKKPEEIKQDAPVAPQIVKEEPREQIQAEVDESPVEQMIVDSTAEPVKKANEDRNGKQTHLVSL